MAPERPNTVLRSIPPQVPLFDRLSKTVWVQTLLWVNAATTLNLTSYLSDAFKTRTPHACNHFWLFFDDTIHDLSEMWEREPGSLVKVYGLYEPLDVSRPRIQDDPEFDGLVDELKKMDLKMREAQAKEGSASGPSPATATPASAASAKPTKKPKARKRRGQGSGGAQA